MFCPGSYAMFALSAAARRTTSSLASSTRLVASAMACRSPAAALSSSRCIAFRASEPSGQIRSLASSGNSRSVLMIAPYCFAGSPALSFDVVSRVRVSATSPARRPRRSFSCASAPGEPSGGLGPASYATLISSSLAIVRIRSALSLQYFRVSGSHPCGPCAAGGGLRVSGNGSPIMFSAVSSPSPRGCCPPSMSSAPTAPSCPRSLTAAC